MAGDDVAHRVGQAALHRDRDPGEGMAEILATGALAAAALAVILVLEELADIGEDGSRDQDIHVDRQGLTEKTLHRSCGVPCHVHDRPLVGHEAHRTVWNLEGERDALEIRGGQRRVLEGPFPTIRRLRTQVFVFDPLELRPNPLDFITQHGLLREERIARIEDFEFRISNLSNNRPTILGGWMGLT